MVKIMPNEYRRRCGVSRGFGSRSEEQFNTFSCVSGKLHPKESTEFVPKVCLKVGYFKLFLTWN